MLYACMFIISTEGATIVLKIFILLDGTRIETDRFMQGPKLSKNCHWWNTDSGWVETKGNLETIDPNNSFLFGYPQDVFLAKQYK